MSDVDGSVFSHRAEFEYPPWEKFLEKKYLLPLVCYFLLWRLLAYFVCTFLWTGFQGFRQYRLRNLTVCVTHSFFTGASAILFSIMRPKVMLEDTMHWWDDSCAHVFLISIAYFIHDSLDMLSHEWSKWMLELLAHHLMTIFVFVVQITTHKFQPFAFWALLMEVSSVFLHSRSLIQLSGSNLSRPRLYRYFSWLNILACIIFRFCVQAWQISWVIEKRDEMSYFYFCIGFYGGIIFWIINLFLFYRVLSSDGYLGEKRRAAMPNRDNQTFLAEINHLNDKKHG